MALPGLLASAAQKVSSGTNRLIVASRISSVANSPLTRGLARATGASRVPILDSLGNYAASKDKNYKTDKKSKDSSTSKNKDKAREDAEKNQERQEKARKDSQRDKGEDISLLRVIAKDTVRVRDAVESLVKKQDDTKNKSGGGLLGSLASGVSSVASTVMSVLGGGVLGKLGGKALGGLSKVGGSVAKMGGKLLGMAGIGGKSAIKSADDVAETLATTGKHAIRDPKTGRFVSRAAAGGVLSAAEGTASKSAGLFGKIAGKGAGAIGKGVAKAAGKSLIKKIPLIGLAAGLGFAANRAMAGDWKGAGLEAASGIVGTIPGLGTAASIGIDAALLNRDLKKANSEPGAATAPSAAPLTAVPSPIQNKTNVLLKQPEDKNLKLLTSMTNVLTAMLVRMSNKDKGVYVIPAQTGDSSLNQPQKADFSGVTSRDLDSGTAESSRIGPVTYGADGPTTGESMHAPRSSLKGERKANEEALLRQAAAAGITDPTELAQLRAQVEHESGGFRYTEEQGKKSYFRRYEGRKDLGNTQSGDGYKYRGRGQIQLTGRSNYAAFAKYSGVDVVNNPDLLSQDPDLAAQAAIWYWQTRVKPKVSDFNDTRRVTKLINGGYNGLSDREDRFSSLLATNDNSAIRAVNTSPTQMVRAQAVASSQTSKNPIVIQQAPQVAITQTKGSSGGQVASSTPVILRNPDSPVRNNINTLIRTT